MDKIEDKNKELKLELEALESKKASEKPEEKEVLEESKEQKEEKTEDFKEDPEKDPEKDLEEKPEEKPEEKEIEVDEVKAALDLNTKLKDELEAFKAQNSNVYEENETLKKEIEDQKKLMEMAAQNAEMTAKLEAIKKDTLIGGLMSSGRINKDLKEWAGNLSYEQLLEFNRHAPRVKTILDEKNSYVSENTEFEEWHKEQSIPRIIS